MIGILDLHKVFHNNLQFCWLSR